MVEIEASRKAMEEHAQTNEELEKSLHQRVRRSTRERYLNLPARDNPVPPHYITSKISFFTEIKDPEIILRHSTLR